MIELKGRVACELSRLVKFAPLSIYYYYYYYYYLLLLLLLVFAKKSCDSFSTNEKQPKPCTHDFSCFLSKLISENSNNWFIMLFAPVVIGLTNQLLCYWFLESNLKTTQAYNHLTSFC